MTGEFWSDDLCGIASPVRDADRRVKTASDLAELLIAVAVPSDEALVLAGRVLERRNRSAARGLAGGLSLSRRPAQQ